MKQITQFLKSNSERVSAAKENSPFDTEFFQVQAAGLKCMAYRDDHGKWRAAFGNGELSGLVRVLE